MKTLRYIVVGAFDDAAVLVCGIAALVTGASIALANSDLWHLGDVPMGLWPDRDGVIGIATAAAGAMALEVVGRRWVELVRRTRRREVVTDGR